MLLNLAAWAIVAVGYGMQFLTHPIRQDIRVLSGALLGTVGASCMFASVLVADEAVVIGLRAGALILFVGSIVFYGIKLVRNG